MENISETLRSAVLKPRERHFLLRLESHLISFINQIAKYSNVPSHKSNRYMIESYLLTNSYVRLLAHQLCKYYELQHWNTSTCDIMVSPVEGVDYGMMVGDLSSGVRARLADVPAHLESGEIEDLDARGVSEANQAKQARDSRDTEATETRDTTEDEGAAKEAPKEAKEVTTPETTPETQPHQTPSLPKIHNSHKGPKILKRITKLDSDSEASLRQSDSSKDLDCDTETETVTTTTTDTTLNNSKTDIHDDRAVKEALYMKMRQEIFDKESQEPEEGEEEEEEDDEKQDDDEYSLNWDGSRNNEFNQVHPPYPIPMVPITPIGMAISPQTAQMSQIGQMGQVAVPPYTQMGMQYHNGYYIPPYNGNCGLPFDKETERKLLNNPYIIIPNNNHTKKKNGKRQTNRGQYKQHGQTHYQPNYQTNYQTDYQPNYHTNYQPNLQTNYTPNHQQSYTPNHQQSYTPNYQPNHQPNYQNYGQYTPPNSKNSQVLYGKEKRHFNGPQKTEKPTFTTLPTPTSPSNV